jgi:hypothetical protein
VDAIRGDIADEAVGTTLLGDRGSATAVEQQRAGRDASVIEPL